MKFYVELALGLVAVALALTWVFRPVKNYAFRTRIPAEAITSIIPGSKPDVCPDGYEPADGDGYVKSICFQRYTIVKSTVISHLQVMTEGEDCATGYKKIGEFSISSDRAQALCAKMEPVDDATHFITGIYEVLGPECEVGDSMVGSEAANAICAKYTVLPYSISQMSIFGQPKNPLAADVQTIADHVERMNQFALAVSSGTLSEVTADDIGAINKALIHYEEIVQATREIPDHPFVISDGKIRVFDGTQTREFPIAPETYEILEHSDMISYVTDATMQWVAKKSSLPPPPMAYLRGTQVHRAISSVESPDN